MRVLAVSELSGLDSVSCSFSVMLQGGVEMAWVPADSNWISYVLELRDHQDLPDALKSKINESEWQVADEQAREALIVDAGGSPRDQRGN